jgi:hypothetical protein
MPRWKLSIFAHVLASYAMFLAIAARDHEIGLKILHWQMGFFIIVAAAPMFSPIVLVYAIALHFADLGAESRQVATLTCGIYVGASAIVHLLPVARRFLTPRGHCLTCGYDLRASSGRCPECGAPIPNGISVPHSGHLPVDARKS